MRLTSFILLCSLSFFAARAQDSIQTYALSLQQAIVYGLENNYAVKNAGTDVAIALKQKWEIISQGLPQVTGDINYQNQLIQPVSFIPAQFFDQNAPAGKFLPVTFSPKQSMNATATLNQLLFDGSYIVGIQSAKTLLQISENAKVKTDLEIKEQITSAYGNVLLAEESVLILQKNLKTVEKNLNDTQKIFENGLGEEEDVEQLEITRLGLDTDLNNAMRQLAIAYDMLKVTLGMPLENKVMVTDDLESLSMQYYDLVILKTEVNTEENIDYRIAEDQANLAEVQVKLEKSKALPRLTAFVNYGTQTNGNDFVFLDKDVRYFDQSILGVTLSVPLFSSGMRSARTAQKELNFQKSLEDLERTRNEVRLRITSARNDYRFALDNYGNQKKNLNLAERIEKKNEVKFFEGISTSFDLSRAQQQLFSAQQQFLQAMLNVITNKAALEKVLDTSTYKPKG